MMQEDSLFSEVDNHWDLSKLYEQVEYVKRQQTGQKQLTVVEKACLRGLLCGYSPEQIAGYFLEEPYGLIINLIWRLHRSIQTMTGREPQEIESYQDIPNWLEAAGYRNKHKIGITRIQLTRIQHESELQSCSPTKEQSISSPGMFYPLEEQTEQLLQGGNNGFSASSSSAENTVEYASKTSIYPKLPGTGIQPQPKILPEHTGLNRVEEEQKSKVLPPETKKPAYTSSEQTTALTIAEPRHIQSSIVPSPHKSLPVVAEDNFLPPISRWTRLGGLFIAGCVGVAIALAAFTPYNVTVRAQAKVRPAGGLKIVEAETEGTIIDIRAGGNQVVKKGEVIAVIDNSRLATRRSQLDSNIQQANLQMTQIQAQITSQNHRIWAETDRMNRAIASAQSQLNLRRREYQDRKITTTAQVTEAQANLGLAQEELHQAQTELTSAQASFRSAEAALTSAISRRNRYQEIAASGALSQNQLEEAQLEVEQRRQDVVAQQAAIERQQREIARRKQAVAAAQARVRNVQASLNPSNAEVAIATENIAQEQANGQANLATLRREKEALIQQGIEIQKQLERYTSELKQIEKDLQQTTIKASADGVLFQLTLNNPGQTVLPGEEIARIAPMNTSLSIAALVPAQEIGNLETGQLAQIKVSACPYPDYGVLQGVVSDIAPDAIAIQSNDSTASNTTQAASQAFGSAFYQVTIQPESLTLGKPNNQCSLQLGMEGVADITTKEETVLKFMLRKARLLTDM